MKVYIIGDSKGLGAGLKNLFQEDGYEVIGFKRIDYDIEKDFLKIVATIEEDSIVLINAYANGTQIKILKELINKNSKIIVMGSIASRYPDPKMLEYSNHKRELDEYFMKQAIEKKKSDLLLLNLTGKSYLDSRLIYDSIKFWLVNTDIISISYRTK